MWGLQDQDKGEGNVSLVSCTKFKGASKKLSNVNDMKAVFQKSKLMHRLDDAQKIKILNKVRNIYFLLVLVSNMLALVSNMT